MEDQRMMAAAEFARDQANRALASRNMAEASVAVATAAGLPLHPDRPKNWDNLIAVASAHAADRGGIILDAGGGKTSAFLPGLASLGHQRLLALNTEFRYPEWSGGAEYRPGDATATGLPDGSVDFLACLSVVEHGVDERALAEEAARVLRPGGGLMISTDYWVDKVDSMGQTAWGVPIKVYDFEEIMGLCSTVWRAGFATAGRLDLECGERTVNWMGMDYTFCNLLFTKGEA